MGSTTYPQISRIQLGYEARVDRVLAVAHLVNGGTLRLWFPRRVMAKLLDHLSKELAASHPAAERTPSQDEVLQMEHLAAVASQRKQEDKARSGDAGTHADGADGGNVEVETEIPSALVTAAQLERRDDGLLLGLLGFSDDTLEPSGAAPRPLAAFKLDRPRAHQILRMLRDQAERAEWGLAYPAPWMAPIKAGDKNKTYS